MSAPAQHHQQEQQQEEERTWDQRADYIAACDTRPLANGRTSYPTPRPQGRDDPHDVTSFHPGQWHWSAQNMPEIIYELLPNTREMWDTFRSTRPKQKLDANQEPIFEQWPRPGIPRRPLLDFPILPDQIGTEEDAWYLEAVRRLDPRISWNDIEMRMMFTGIRAKYVDRDNEKNHPEMKRFMNSQFNNRVGRLFRPEFKLLSWYSRQLEENPSKEDQKVQKFLTPEHFRRNSTRGLTPGLVDIWLPDTPDNRIQLPIWVGLKGSQKGAVENRRRAKKEESGQPDSSKKRKRRGPSDDDDGENNDGINQTDRHVKQQKQIEPKEKAQRRQVRDGRDQEQTGMRYPDPISYDVQDMPPHSDDFSGSETQGKPTGLFDMSAFGEEPSQFDFADNALEPPFDGQQHPYSYQQYPQTDLSQMPDQRDPRHRQARLMAPPATNPMNQSAVIDFAYQEQPRGSQNSGNAPYPPMHRIPRAAKPNTQASHAGRSSGTGNGRYGLGIQPHPDFSTSAVYDEAFDPPEVAQRKRRNTHQDPYDFSPTTSGQPGRHARPGYPQHAGRQQQPANDRSMRPPRHQHLQPVLPREAVFDENEEDEIDWDPRISQTTQATIAQQSQRRKHEAAGQRMNRHDAAAVAAAGRAQNPHFVPSAEAVRTPYIYKQTPQGYYTRPSHTYENTMSPHQSPYMPNQSATTRPTRYDVPSGVPQVNRGGQRYQDPRFHPIPRETPSPTPMMMGRSGTFAPPRQNLYDDNLGPTRVPLEEDNYISAQPAGSYNQQHWQMPPAAAALQQMHSPNVQGYHGHLAHPGPQMVPRSSRNFQPQNERGQIRQDTGYGMHQYGGNYQARRSGTPMPTIPNPYGYRDTPSPAPLEVTTQPPTHAPASSRTRGGSRARGGKKPNRDVPKAQRTENSREAAAPPQKHPRQASEARTSDIVRPPALAPAAAPGSGVARCGANPQNSDLISAPPSSVQEAQNQASTFAQAHEDESAGQQRSQPNIEPAPTIPQATVATVGAEDTGFGDFNDWSADDFVKYLDTDLTNFDLETDDFIKSLGGVEGHQTEPNVAEADDPSISSLLAQPNEDLAPISQTAVSGEAPQATAAVPEHPIKDAKPSQKRKRDLSPEVTILPSDHDHQGVSQEPNAKKARLESTAPCETKSQEKGSLDRISDQSSKKRRRDEDGDAADAADAADGPQEKLAEDPPSVHGGERPQKRVRFAELETDVREDMLDYLFDEPPNRVQQVTQTAADPIKGQVDSNDLDSYTQQYQSYEFGDQTTAPSFQLMPHNDGGFNLQLPPSTGPGDGSTQTAIAPLERLPDPLLSIGVPAPTESHAFNPLQPSFGVIDAETIPSDGNLGYDQDALGLLDQPGTENPLFEPSLGALPTGDEEEIQESQQQEDQTVIPPEQEEWMAWIDWSACDRRSVDEWARDVFGPEVYREMPALPPGVVEEGQSPKDPSLDEEDAKSRRTLQTSSQTGAEDQGNA